MKHLTTMLAGWCLAVSIQAEEPDIHWAFRPVDPGPIPESSDGSDHPVDRFIRSAQPEGVTSVGLANRRTLIRRASFDLTGLSPTPEQVAAFLADDQPGAFDRVIEGLLASPRYGERWGRYWLDLARYADTAGENSDYPIREAYRYRDYVIDAFNRDTPYDRFLHEQLAGNILAETAPPEQYADLITATGFVAHAKRFGTRKLEDMHLIIEDNLQTLGQAVMGLSMKCARCHDHKYDPITMKDYYAMYGFFQSTAYPFPGAEETRRPSELVATTPPVLLKQQDEHYLAEHAADIDRLKAELVRIGKEDEAGQRVAELKTKIAQGGEQVDDQKKQLKEAEKKLAEARKPTQQNLDKILGQKPSKTVAVAYAVREGTPTDAKIHLVGNHNRLGETVPRGVPDFLAHVGEVTVPEGKSGRLELARWLTRKDHPLTARVMANRIWQHHFGKAIVGTPSDFGIRGEKPTHPELLDWLAVEFVERGWSIKAMHKLIMTSKTYQLASSDDSKNAALDDANHFYWRFDRRRLDAEAIRDALLFVSGELDVNRPSQHPFPPVEKWGFTAHHQFKAVYPSKHRTVYLMVQRLHHHPFLKLFDGPDTSVSVGKRDQSTVAHQALFMVNSEFVHQQARAYAKRLLALDAASRVKRAYEQAYARPPSVEELDRAEKFLAHYLELLTAEGHSEEKREEEAWAGLARVILAGNEFIYVD